jgi:hypothetical protein
MVRSRGFDNDYLFGLLTGGQRRAEIAADQKLNLFVSLGSRSPSG